MINEMEAAYRKFPENPEIILVLARAYAGEGNRRNAVLLYRRFLELVPASHPTRQAVQDELSAIGG